MVDRSGNRNHQHVSVSAEARKSQIDEENAGSTAGNRQNQRKIQGASFARSQAGGKKRGDDGLVPEGGYESHVGLHTDAGADALPLGVLQSTYGVDCDARRELALGFGSVPT